MRDAGIVKWRFAYLKSSLRMSHWWSSKQELILVQIWVVLLLAHLVYAPLVNGLHEPQPVIPLRCRCHGTVELVPRLGSSSAVQLEQLVQSGRKSGRLACQSPARAECPAGRVFPACGQPHLICPDNGPDVPHRLHASARLSLTSVCVAIRHSDRGVRPPNKLRRCERPKPKRLRRQRQSPDRLLI